MRIIFMTLCFFVLLPMYSQHMLPKTPYFDVIGAEIRGGKIVVGKYAEKASVTDFRKKVDQTRKEMGYLAVPSNNVDGSRTLLESPKKRIQFHDYKNVCNTYLNPFKKKKCNDKITYLNNAEQLTYDMITNSTKYKINNGLKKQIQQKYIDIHNRILRELEFIKQEAEKAQVLSKIIKP